MGTPLDREDYILPPKHYQPKAREALKYIRERYSLTQRDLAEFLGVAENTVTRWESGALKIGAPVLALLALEALAARLGRPVKPKKEANPRMSADDVAEFANYIRNVVPSFPAGSEMTPIPEKPSLPLVGSEHTTR